MKKILKEKRAQFMEQTFSSEELTYCQSFKDSAHHFAGTFAAKEAVRKATGKLALSFKEIEIRRNKNGKPELFLRGKRAKNVSVSISHTETLATAVAIEA